MWSRDRRVTWLCWLWSLSLTHHSAKSGGHKSCGSGDMIYSHLYVRRRARILSYCKVWQCNFAGFFWHTLYYKVRQSSFITKCDRLLLRSESRFTKCDSYYKVRRNRGNTVKQFFLLFRNVHILKFAYILYVDCFLKPK